MATNMKRYELSLHDFEAIRYALDAAIFKTKILAQDSERAFGSQDKVTLTILERQRRMEDLKEKFEASHTGWLEIEENNVR